MLRLNTACPAMTGSSHLDDTHLPLIFVSMKNDYLWSSNPGVSRCGIKDQTTVQRGDYAALSNSGITGACLYHFSSITKDFQHALKQPKGAQYMSVTKSGGVLIFKPRGQCISLWCGSCTPAITSVTALHSNGRIKVRPASDLHSPPHLSLSHSPASTVWQSATDSRSPPATDDLCSALIQASAPLSFFFKSPCQNDESFMFLRRR